MPRFGADRKLRLDAPRLSQAPTVICVPIAALLAVALVRCAPGAARRSETLEQRRKPHL